MSQRQGVIFDVEDQAAEALGPYQPSHQKLANSSPFAPEEETPLQQPRPPERPRKRSLQHRWSQRLSSVIYSNRNLWKTSGNNPPSELDATKSCKEVACVVLLPSLLLSLVLIGVCSLFIYLHLLHKYHSEIDTLKAELKAARDKDGVFLPKDIYDMQMQDRDKSELSLRRKTQELKSLEVKLEKFKAAISEMSTKLENSMAQRNKTQEALDCTRTVLHKHEGKNFGQVHVLSQNIENECKLRQQAQLLLTVSDEATKDIFAANDEKASHIIKQDSSSSRRIVFDKSSDNLPRSSSSSSPAQLEQLISGHVQVQSDLCSQTRNNIDSVAERRAEERTQITATYAETVSKLIHIIGDLERLTSEHMYSEQSWVEQLLKRVRNEADSATNDFHGYLVDQLLTVSTKILASLQTQDKSVQELSAKMDKNFAGLALKLDSYLKEQNAIKHRKSQAEVDFFDGLERRNSALSVAFEDEIKVTEDYVKKSQAFTEQMMSLIKARAKEEDTYLNARNASINNALALTLATSEATTSAERDSKEFLNAMSKTETKYRDANEEIMMKIKSEKASAMEDINTAGKKAAKATARLRADAESFAQKAKDQWADHYSRTEATLREKSDKSSSHVTNLQGKTGVARKIIQSGQSAAEATIENWRRADDKATRKSHETASAQCAVLTDFGSKLRDEIRAAHQTMSKIDETRTK